MLLLHVETFPGPHMHALGAAQHHLDFAPDMVVSGSRLEGHQLSVHQVLRHFIEDLADIAQLADQERGPAGGLRHVA